MSFLEKGINKCSNNGKFNIALPLKPFLFHETQRGGQPNGPRGGAVGKSAATGWLR